MLSMIRRYAFAPSQAAQASRDKANLAPNVIIYALFATASLIFFWLKPFDFPDANAALPGKARGLLFWFKVMLWQPPLELAWIAFLLGLTQWLRGGKLVVRLTAAALWTALTFVLIISYWQKLGLGQLGFALGCLASFALFVPAVRNFPAAERLPVVSFMLGLNALGLIMLAPTALAAALRSSVLFNAAQIAGGIWMIGAGALGLRRLTGIRLARAFMAMLLSMFFQIALACALYLLGVVPKDILQALLYA